jgi:hypothetical protein
MKLLDVDKIDLIVGAYGTALTAPVIPIVIQRKKTFIGFLALAVNSEFITRTKRHDPIRARSEACLQAGAFSMRSFRKIESRRRCPLWRRIMSSHATQRRVRGRNIL